MVGQVGCDKQQRTTGPEQHTKAYLQYSYVAVFTTVTIAKMVNQKAQDAVQKSLDSVTGDPKNGVPGLVFVAVGKDGKQIAAHASGRTGLNKNRPPMTMDTVFWIASCTKLLATIACMQAVEQGKLMLDDAKFVYKLCPELEKVKVLQEDGSLVDKKRDITLRMLLTHTAGFGYEFFNPKLRDYGKMPLRLSRAR